MSLRFVFALGVIASGNFLYAMQQERQDLERRTQELSAALIPIQQRFEQILIEHEFTERDIAQIRQVTNEFEQVLRRHLEPFRQLFPQEQNNNFIAGTTDQYRTARASLSPALRCINSVYNRAKMLRDRADEIAADAWRARHQEEVTTWRACGFLISCVAIPLICKILPIFQDNFLTYMVIMAGILIYTRGFEHPGVRSGNARNYDSIVEIIGQIRNSLEGVNNVLIFTIGILALEGMWHKITR